MSGKIKWVVGDALEWLRKHKDVGSVVTGIADSNEIGWSVERWEPWFVEIARLSMEAASEDCVAIFCQTDRKANGGWVSKVSLMMQAAEQAKSRLLWHKITLRKTPGTIDLYRPGYTNMLAFSKKARVGKATPDVLMPSTVLWPNATSTGAAMVSLQYAKKFSNKVVDPFCGWGTIPAIAAAMDMEAVGVDIDPKQIEKAKKLKVRMKNGLLFVEGKPVDEEEDVKNRIWKNVLSRLDQEV